MTHNVHSTVRDLEVLAEKFAARSTDGSPLSKSAALNLITRTLLGDGHDWAAIKNADKDISSQRYRAAQEGFLSNAHDTARSERLWPNIPRSTEIARIAKEAGLNVIDIKVPDFELNDVLGMPQKSSEQTNISTRLTRERFYILNKLEATGVPLRVIEFNHPGIFDPNQPGLAHSLLLEMEQDGLLLRDNDTIDGSDAFGITQAGRRALQRDPVQVKRQGLSEAMVMHLCWTAVAQESGRPFEAARGNASLVALEKRGLLTLVLRPKSGMFARLTDDGKAAYERIWDREVTFPPEVELG
jgi:hypothetical protein